MSLFLTSDEVSGKYNSRSNFSNSISPDFFQDSPFNISLKEVYFDPNFPSLPFLNAPHIITLVDPNRHEYEDLSEDIRDRRAFTTLFTHDNNRQVHASLKIDKDYIEMLDESRTEYEVHHRLNYAICISSLKDVNFKSSSEVVSFLNKYMFPLHSTKPLIYEEKIQKLTILSKFDMFFSQSLLALLGLKSVRTAQILPLVNFPPVFDRVPEEIQMAENHRDSLARMEEESILYRNYRQMTRHDLKCEMIMHYRCNGVPSRVSIEIIIKMFEAKKPIVFDFDKHFQYVNKTLRENFLTNTISKTMDYVHFTRSDILVFKNTWGRVIDKVIQMNLGEWGGLVTFQSQDTSKMIVPFHNKQNLDMVQAIALDENLSNSPAILQESFNNIFFATKIEQIEFDETLCTLYGLNKRLIFNSDSDEYIPLDCNYFRCARRELEKSFDHKPYSLAPATQGDKMENSNMIESVFRTERETFHFLKAGQSYGGDEDINLACNDPKLIFVVGNFLQHSLYGSRQEKIINFFPMNHKKDDLLYHNFKNPICLNINQEPNFHIKLLDQNLRPLKAGVGIPTLLSFKKTSKKNMFPVTVVSSDAENLKLYPQNSSNCFTNKLSFPLIFADRRNWTVSLRCIAFPKLCNITPKNCYIDLKEITDEGEIEMRVVMEASYISNIHSLVAYINRSMEAVVRDSFAPSPSPKFDVKNEKVVLSTNNFICILSQPLMLILGMTHSFLDNLVIYPEKVVIEGVAKPELFLYQPKEIIAISNIVEESFYAQTRPNILRIIPVRNQEKSLGSYNFIEFQEPDNIKLAIDRIQDIEVKLFTRKGDFVDFVNENDVKIQLEFKKKQKGNDEVTWSHPFLP